MGPLLQKLIGICLFRDGPQDLPYSATHLLALIAGSMALTYIAAGNLPDTDAVGLQVAVATGFSLAFLYALLLLRGLTPRFIQSATAMFGTDVLIGIPVTLMTFPIATYGVEQAGGAAAGILLLWFWQVAILGHIFRHTLEMRLALGILLALAYSFLSFQVVQLAAD
ncbi:hypothetical protein [Halorhodospira halophila]|uniref:Yip1 domain-containing protein n=1 Tax=Halorhodospira halophila (strain DSM 244 / SL1) TaxID=349124 RepID=A1WYK8_HALHL|nr:hypothetical protein [Halorhodospira halophila]ABM62770.1 conserved hypothetical protein [Halorhodospira halophila SL1]MBK1728107.1 hypothetical protein [Halorhodospira halophila]